MTLGFSLAINGKPSYFPEKVILSLYRIKLFKDQDFQDHFNLFLNSKFRLWKNRVIMEGELKPKLHTIRQDTFRRWKEGNKIHFVINNRTPERMQFAPVMNCTGVQGICISPNERIVLVEILICGLKSWKAVFDDDIEQLAINDGFDSVEEFWAYFKEPFEGVIIHWTDKRY